MAVIGSDFFFLFSTRLMIGQKTLGGPPKSFHCKFNPTVRSLLITPERTFNRLVARFRNHMKHRLE